MPYKKRSLYKQDGKVRDYNLFVIVTEGSKREVEYLAPFNIIDRIKVICLTQNEENRGSSPDRVQYRMEEYINEVGLSKKDGDSLWCIIDVDKWPVSAINSLADYCRSNECAHIIISNPCFEIWLLYHKFSNVSDCHIDVSNAHVLKEFLGRLDPGGYNYHSYIPLMEVATRNSKEQDTNISPNDYIPKVGGTKMYILAEEMLKSIGKRRWSKFIENIKHIDVILNEDGSIDIVDRRLKQ